MSNNSVFNATVCIIGILILLIHTVNIVMKKNKRRDEWETPSSGVTFGGGAGSSVTGGAPIGF
ncbi:MAG: hypothetical protein IJ851_02940 [Eubacterium sp.]|nr:hypothetical protein [Eubacterium sp.]